MAEDQEPKTVHVLWFGAWAVGVIGVLCSPLIVGERGGGFVMLWQVAGAFFALFLTSAVRICCWHQKTGFWALIGGLAVIFMAAIIGFVALVRKI